VTLQHNLAQLMPPTDDLASLITRTADGDEVALAGLYDATCSQVYGLAVRILGDHPVAEEAASDVYMQVWRQAVRFDPNRGAPLGWLLTITRSRAIDRLRTHGKRQEMERDERENQTPAGDSDTAGPEQHAAVAEGRHIVCQALMRLSPHERRAIELAYFEGLSHTEIAAALDTPLGTVKTRIRTGMTRLRATLGSQAQALL
jgi:RNA polymerase sigma-70 factor (ECF subfamily)